jgi:hypothetical protein
LAALTASRRHPGNCAAPLAHQAAFGTTREWVGLNLDIPHYSFIARHTPDQIPESVRRFIVHSHISSHSFGHFADGILDELDTQEGARQKNTCLAWIMLIENLIAQGHSGYISLELECAKTRSQVVGSLANLRKWLRP